MLNTASIIGRLGTDPEVTRDGDNCIAMFELACNEFYKQGNDLAKKTHRIPCITFGRLAEIVSEFLTCHSQVGVRGALNTEEISDGNGSKRLRLVIKVAELEFLSSAPSRDID